MPQTAEHRAEVSLIARERVRGGHPVWDRTIRLADVFHNEDMTLKQRRDAIVRRLRSSHWLKGHDDFDDLTDAVEGLASAADATEFDGWWDEICDHADFDRIWLETR